MLTCCMCSCNVAGIGGFQQPSVPRPFPRKWKNDLFGFVKDPPPPLPPRPKLISTTNAFASECHLIFLVVQRHWHQCCLVENSKMWRAGFELKCSELGLNWSVPELGLNWSVQSWVWTEVFRAGFELKCSELGLNWSVQSWVWTEVFRAGLSVQWV